MLLPALQGSERGGTRATLSTGVFKNIKNAQPNFSSCQAQLKM